MRLIVTLFDVRSFDSRAGFNVRSRNANLYWLSGLRVEIKKNVLNFDKSKAVLTN